MSTEKNEVHVPRKELVALRKENKILKETVSVLSDSTILRDIRKSLHELEKGKYTEIK